MTTHRGVPTHAHCIMFYNQKCWETPVFKKLNSIMQKLSKETQQSDNKVLEWSEPDV